MSTDEKPDAEAKIFFRAPLSLAKKFDEVYKPESPSRADKLRGLMEEVVTKATGVQPKPTFNYEAKSDKLDGLKRERSKIAKTLECGKIGRLSAMDFLINFSIRLEWSDSANSTRGDKRNITFEEPHLTSLIKKLWSYKLKLDDQFNEDDLDAWIKYLELTLEIHRLRDQLTAYRVKMLEEKELSLNFNVNPALATENEESTPSVLPSQEIQPDPVNQEENQPTENEDTDSTDVESDSSSDIDEPES
ncbi:MAG: hypothetical protein ABSF65_05845 [Candidatus Bathyarchaeia archaeon]